MRQMAWAVAVWLLLLGSLAGPDPAHAQTGTGQPAGSIEVGADATTDAEIRDRIRQVLSEIEGYAGVTVSVSSGVVTLSGDVLDGTAEAELSTIVSRVEGVVAIESEVRQSADLNERLAPAVDRLSQRVETILVNAPIVLVALAVFLAIATLGWFLTRRVRLWERIAPNRFIADIYSAVARIAITVLGLIVALDILNATALIGAVLGAAGVVGLAVGFAVRDTVENFIASILLSLRQPFRPNDFIEIGGDMGNVARLTSRATILISPDGNHIRVPNSTVFKGRIVNYSRDPKRRFTFTLGVAPDCDLAEALSVSIDALRRLPFVLEDPPVGAWIEEVGPSNVVLTFAGWVNQHETDFVKARGEAIRVTKFELEEAGFGLPEPTYRVRLDRARAVKAHEDHSVTPLPAAAAPDNVEQATEEAVDRERIVEDGAANLLSETRETE